jgi:hypothetical protein
LQSNTAVGGRNPQRLHKRRPKPIPSIANSTTTSTTTHPSSYQLHTVVGGRNPPHINTSAHETNLLR